MGLKFYLYHTGYLYMDITIRLIMKKGPIRFLIGLGPLSYSNLYMLLLWVFWVSDLIYKKHKGDERGGNTNLPSH